MEELKKLGRKILRDFGMEDKGINIVWYSGWTESHLGTSQVVVDKKVIGTRKNPQRVVNRNFEEIVVTLNKKLKNKGRKAKEVFLHELLHVIFPLESEENIHDLTDFLFQVYGEKGKRQEEKFDNEIG